MKKRFEERPVERQLSLLKSFAFLAIDKKRTQTPRPLREDGENAPRVIYKWRLFYPKALVLRRKQSPFLWVKAEKYSWNFQATVIKNCAHHRADRHEMRHGGNCGFPNPWHIRSFIGDEAF